MANYLMSKVDLVMATGAQGVVRAAYSSGSPLTGLAQGTLP